MPFCDEGQTQLDNWDKETATAITTLYLGLSSNLSDICESLNKNNSILKDIYFEIMKKGELKWQS